MSQARPSAAHPRAAPTRIGRQAPAATARANTAPSSATRRVLARSRGRQYCRRHAKSCEPAMPTVVRSNGLAPALPALHGAQAKQSVDRRPARASRLPLSVSDSSCHSAADSTPVLLRKAASLRLPSYLHARRSRNFRSAVLALGRNPDIGAAVIRLEEAPMAEDWQASSTERTLLIVDDDKPFLQRLGERWRL